MKTSSGKSVVNGVEDKPITEEQTNILKLLVRRIVRAFYPPEYVVLVDYLSVQNSVSIRPDELASKLKLHLRYVRRLLIQLRQDKIIRSEVKYEVRGSQKKKMIPLTHWYIDYKQLVDIIKFKIYKMRHTVEGTLKKEMEYQDYVCPKCEHSYGALDAMALLNSTTLLFHCEFCNSALEQRDNSSKIALSRQMHGKLMEQISPILKLIKETDHFVIPTHKKPPPVTRNAKGVPIAPPETTLETHLSKTGDAVIHDSIVVAGSEEGNQSLPEYWGAEGKITVEIEETDSLPLKKQSAESKKQTLPTWITQSSVPSDKNRVELEHDIAIDSLEEEKEPDLVSFDNEEVEAEEEEEDDTYEDYYTRYYEQLQSKQHQVTKEKTDEIPYIEISEPNRDTVSLDQERPL